jgi:exodeoxyribonuclease V gamma subunit
MAIELYFSNQLDQLADKFSDVMTDEVRGKDNILEPSVVIVPNANLAKWLQLLLAGKNAIFMNIEFQYLEAGLWEMLAALDCGEIKPDMMDIDQLKFFLLHILQNLDRSDADFLPMTQYLFGEDDAADRPDDAARLWQLSEKMAHLFKEYEFHRTDMIRNWAVSSTETEGMQRCQQRLYDRLKRLRDELAGRTGKQLLSTMEYADLVLSGSRTDERKAADPQSVHFFGLSQISNFHLTLIGRLQDDYTIHIYTMNPCEEFWEDIQTPREKRWIQRKNVKTLAIQTSEQDQGKLLQQTDNALLAAWGKPGRESVRLLCQLTDYNFKACFTTAEQAAEILHRIQNDILTLSCSEPEAKRIEQDRSLQIVACPSIYREVETVYNSVLFNLAQDDRLQLTDIAILVPDMSAYKPVFDSVFNRRPRQLVYNLVDSQAEIESIYGNAVLAILKLATGRFSRNEVFDLILNPCFMSRWKIGSDEVQAWVNWTRELNVFHSFDRDSKAARGYSASGNFTWKQGLERLRLSRIMAAPNAIDPASFKHYQERVPFSDVKTSDADLVEKFCMVIESLDHAVSRLNSSAISAKQWKQHLFLTCDQLIEIPQDFKGEAVVRQALLKAFDNLALYDCLQGGASPSALDIGLIREFIRANLGSISGGHGNYLTDGVTISALQPMRPIPFRIVYVLGMEEGRFPGKADLSSLDLRLSKRRIGDISLPERNCYLFLEMLLSVREKLTISYVARDLQKDRLQQPCSVINQLKRYIEQEMLPDGQSFRVLEVPLAGCSGRYLDPDAISAWSDVLVNDSLTDRVAYYRTHRLWEAFKHRASKDDLARVARFDPNLSLDATVPDIEDRQVEKITSRQLKTFLEHPVRLKIQRHLGLYDEEETIEDIVLREDEPFFSEFPLDYRLKMDPIKLWMDAYFSEMDAETANLDPAAFYHQVYDACRRKSQTPEGAFAAIDRDEILNHVRQIAETLKPVLEQMQSAKQMFRAVSIGDPAEELIPSNNRLAQKRFNPLSLSVETLNNASETVVQSVALHGQLSWVWRQDSDDAWHVLVLTGSGKRPKEPDKYALEPVLFYLICLVGDDSYRWIESSGLTVHIGYREIVKEWTYRFDRKTAEAYLVELVSNVLNQSMREWLPFEPVTTRSIRPHKLSEDEVNDVIRMQFTAEIEEAFAEEEDYLIRIAKPTIPADAFDWVRRRFKLYFDRTDV